MKKWYYVWRCYGDNEYYYLRYADAGAPVPEGWERISRKEAERMRTDNRINHKYWYVCRCDYGDLDILSFTADDAEQ